MTTSTTTTAATSESLGQKVITGLENGLKLVEAVGPVAAAIGGPAVKSVVNIATEVLGFAEILITAVEEGKTVLDAQSLDQIRALSATLQAQNDSLAAQVDAS